MLHGSVPYFSGSHCNDSYFYIQVVGSDYEISCGQMECNCGRRRRKRGVRTFYIISMHGAGYIEPIMNVKLLKDLKSC